ncbi:MAG TPA: outer membrane beta-barrel protein [Holophagaceae bacterium]|nr:outer membrane beta-barrel protein [Holophagaceae bacterium]
MGALRELLVGMAALVSLQAQGPSGPGGWYLGGTLDRVTLRIPGRSVEMEGIQFTDVEASADKAGFNVHCGTWITPHFGVELGVADLGKARATFAYAVPPSETGTGTTDVGVSNATLSFQVAQGIGQGFVFARGGIQFWELAYETTFRLSGGGSQYRLLEKRGNSFFWGAGGEWNLRGAWNLRLEGRVLKMDITDAKVIGFGLSYRFGGLP